MVLRSRVTARSRTQSLVGDDIFNIEFELQAPETYMPNIASIFKDEISRIARKEVKAQTEQLKKTANGYRSQIAAMKRRLAELERQFIKRSKAARGSRLSDSEDQTTPTFRFSAKGLAKQRQRLGLSAREIGALLGVSQLSVYKWEKGQVRPRASQMQAISQLRRMGKKEAAAKLSKVES